MARPVDGWGSPSFSQDIADNYMRTHHEDDNGEMVRNDEEYLNSLYDDNYSPSDGVVHYAYGLLNDLFFEDVMSDEEYMEFKYGEYSIDELDDVYDEDF